MRTATDHTAALADRLIARTVGALKLYSICLGVELGLYQILETHGPSMPAELAGRAGIAPRHAREWLEQQAVAGLLDVEQPAAAADTRRYALAGIGGVLPHLVDA